MENGRKLSPSASQLKVSSRFPVPQRGLVKAKIAKEFIRLVMAPFGTNVVSKDNDHQTRTGGEGDFTGAGDGDGDGDGDGTTGNSSAASTGMNNSPNGKEK